MTCVSIELGLQFESASRNHELARSVITNHSLRCSCQFDHSAHAARSRRCLCEYAKTTIFSKTVVWYTR
ncbi:unnamed protein product [Penicillium roqueforti FM164]|uniref:Genomic scaffold, ProqFM164S01 n=1 Tax=Penicillium roqueforti (strain FM164) TaxID=1365484 RepID=W6PVZ6_PENRF|nr:unnamed protein product [Penicillium roqueforti FM164]